VWLRDDGDGSLQALDDIGGSDRGVFDPVARPRPASQMASLAKTSSLRVTQWMATARP